MAAAAGREADVGFAAERAPTTSVADTHRDRPAHLVAPGTPRRKPRSSLPPGRPRRAGAPGSWGGFRPMSLGEGMRGKPGGSPTRTRSRGPVGETWCPPREGAEGERRLIAAGVASRSSGRASAAARSGAGRLRGRRGSGRRRRRCRPRADPCTRAATPRRGTTSRAASAASRHRSQRHEKEVAPGESQTAFPAGLTPPPSRRAAGRGRRTSRSA